MTEPGVEESIDEEVNISHACTDEADNYFARIIGRIEEIIVDENFMNLQNKFLEEYWREFDNEEENKLVYTDIFKKYISTIEKHLEETLSISIKDFNMKHFEQELEDSPCDSNLWDYGTWGSLVCLMEYCLKERCLNKQNELDGEVFEILSTFSDFRAFKNMFLDYKAMKEGRVVDFSQDISISKYNQSLNSITEENNLTAAV